MIERMILQVLGILAIGDLLSTKIFRDPYHNSFSRRFLNAIIVGYGSLILPMVVVGVFFVGHLDEFSMVYYGLSMATLLIKLISTSINRPNLPKIPEDGFERYLTYTIITLIVAFGFFLAIIPERGWDSMNFYLPHSVFFFLEDGILPGINQLNFFPTFKPPLNTLFLTYSLYVSQGMYANLHPYLFLIGTVATIYNFALDIGLEEKVALLACNIFLLMPFTALLVVEFAYYQELPILLFSFSSLYYLNHMIKGLSTSSKYGLLLTLSLSIISKMSGYAVILLVIMSVSCGKWYQRLQLLGLGGLTIFLVRKAAYDIFIGTAIMVLLVGLLLFYVILNYEAKRISWTQLLQIIWLPLLFGILWVWFMIQIPTIQRFLTQTYIDNVAKSVSFTFETARLPEEVLIEHGPRASFLASLLFVFLGSAFSPHLIFFKLHGFIKSIEYTHLIRWCLTYLLLFYAYFSNVSARYLVPLMAPMSIFIAISLFTFIRRFEDTQIQILIVNIAALLSILLIFPTLPLRVFKDGFLLLFYNFHTNYFAFLCYLSLLSLLIFKGLQKLQNKDKRTTKKINSFIIVILLIPYVVLPVSIVSYTQITDQPIESYTSYYYRDAYQDMISHVQGLDMDIDNVVLSTVTPGLAYFLRQPVLDLHMVSGVRVFETVLRNMNQTEAITFIEDIKVKVIVQISDQSPYFDYYTEFFAPLELMKAVDYLDFNQTFSNSEYVVYYR